jgi:hypothetical protein
VVIDTVTGLWWQEPLDTNNSMGFNCATGCTQADAILYCAHLHLGGHCDWRLPTRIELVSIVDVTQQGAAINGSAFPGTPAAIFWTASPYQPSAGNAWYVNFGGGNTGYDAAADNGRARCVR